MSNAVTTVLKRGESLREQTSVIEMTRYLSSRAAAHATFDFSLLSTPSSLFTPPTMKYYLCLAVEKEYPSNKNGREREKELANRFILRPLSGGAIAAEGRRR